MQEGKQPLRARLQLLAWLTLNAGEDAANQPARLAQLDDGNDRAILVQGNQGPAQIVRLGHRGTPSIDVSDEIAILAARPIASLPVYEPLIDPRKLSAAGGTVVARQSLLRNVVSGTAFLNLYIFGIEPEKESQVSAFSVGRGRFLRPDDRAVAVLDKASAEALGVDLDDSFPVPGDVENKFPQDRVNQLIAARRFGDHYR